MTAPDGVLSDDALVALLADGGGDGVALPNRKRSIFRLRRSAAAPPKLPCGRFLRRNTPCYRALMALMAFTLSRVIMMSASKRPKA